MRNDDLQDVVGNKFIRGQDGMEVSYSACARMLGLQQDDFSVEERSRKGKKADREPSTTRKWSLVTFNQLLRFATLRTRMT